MGGDGLADAPGDAFGGGVDAAGGEGGKLVEAAVAPGVDGVGEQGLELVEVHDGFDGVKPAGADGDADVPVVGVERFERSIGQADGVGGVEAGGDGDLEHAFHFRPSPGVMQPLCGRARG